ncbi:murein L,D-transpeptidase [Paracoccus caeni]|uniref:Murein L,D-transpeptidase n=1 Tax=Paracoccus caeni TaxID=657651 RepID=A0A934SJS3_9RHOB|nr:L,D-transpeptidase [Paracoccus caeni]MBK4216394.1 murein L,D-transpeptidase [Paracoccus caeni]
MLPFRPFHIPLALAFLTAAAVPATAQNDLPFSAADIEAATYSGGDLPAGRSALTAKVQVLLDRSGTSPGVIDGYKGGMSQSAIMAFERRAGLPMDGVMDPHVWNLLQAYAAQPVTTVYTITQDDAQGLVDAIPTDYAEKAQMSTLAYTSIAEKLGERFHMDEKFIAFLNPGVSISPGSTIAVMAPGSPIRGEVTRIIIDKTTRRVAAYNASGRMIVDYPATIGSDATPSPSGSHHVATVALNPNYTYNPQKNFQQGENTRALIIPPGPNGPVGTVWIGLTKPTYGIHGTPTPSQLFSNQSNGCVRLTNWDAQELAAMVRGGVTSVEFLPTGVTIADVTGVTPAPVTTQQLETADSATTEPAATTEAQMGTTTTTTTPDASLTYPDPAAAAGAVPVEQPLEDTSEDAADALAPQHDPLSDALSGALPEGFVVPPLEGQ